MPHNISLYNILNLIYKSEILLKKPIRKAGIIYHFCPILAMIRSHYQGAALVA